jgi:hypothetical protein
MSDYVASVDEWCVLMVGDPWQLLFLAQGTHLATLQPFEIYTDRDEAIARIREIWPDWNPPEQLIEEM